MGIMENKKSYDDAINKDIIDTLIDFTNPTDQELNCIKENMKTKTALDSKFTEELREKLQKAKNMQEVEKNLAIFFGCKSGGSGSRKSKASRKSQKVKSKASKSRKSQKSRLSIKYSKKLAKEIELSKEMSKRISKKTPIVSAKHGISLIKRSKKNFKKGKTMASFRDLLVGITLVSAAVNPYEHDLAKERPVDPDTQVHLNWHKGNLPDKKLSSKQHKSWKK